MCRDRRRKWDSRWTATWTLPCKSWSRSSCLFGARASLLARCVKRATCVPGTNASVQPAAASLGRRLEVLGCSFDLEQESLLMTSLLCVCVCVDNGDARSGTRCSSNHAVAIQQFVEARSSFEHGCVQTNDRALNCVRLQSKVHALFFAVNIHCALLFMHVAYSKPCLFLSAPSAGSDLEVFLKFVFSI